MRQINPNWSHLFLLNIIMDICNLLMVLKRFCPAVMIVVDFRFTYKVPVTDIEKRLKKETLVIGVIRYTFELVNINITGKSSRENMSSFFKVN